MPWREITEIAQSFGVPSVIVLAGIFISRLYYKYKLNVEIVRKFKNEELQLLSTILSDKHINQKFLIEQIIETKYGRPVSWREISYLMKLASPSEALSLYSDSNYWIEFPYESDKPKFRGFFEKPNYRKWRKRFNIGSYFLLSFSALIAFLSSPWIFTNINLETAIIYVLIAFIFIVGAIFCLKGFIELKRAENLMSLIEFSEANPDKARERSYLLINN